MRRLITGIVESRDQFNVVGTPCDGADALDKVRNLRPDIVTRGWAVMRQGRYGDAIMILNDVLAIDPANGMARANLG